MPRNFVQPVHGREVSICRTVLKNVTVFATQFSLKKAFLPRRDTRQGHHQDNLTSRQRARFVAGWKMTLLGSLIHPCPRTRAGERDKHTDPQQLYALDNGVYTSL